MKRAFTGMCLALILAIGGFAYAKGEKATDDAATTIRVQVAKLRGKLVYKKGQIKKLERAACEEDEALKAKINELEQERRNHYIAKEPKLKKLYEEQDALDSEIEQIKQGVITAAEAEK